MDVKAKYTGEAGEHFMHIPARDLTTEEWDALSDEQRDALRACAFYTVGGSGSRAATRRTSKDDAPVADEKPSADEKDT